MNKDLEQSMSVIASEFANRPHEYIENILGKCAHEGGMAGENAIHLLAALSQA